VARSDGGAGSPQAFWTASAPWVIPAGSKVTALLDRSQLTTAYPEIVTSGGKGATITLTYAEALRAPAKGGQKGEKGNRNDIAGKVISGLADRFLPDGGDGGSSGHCGGGPSATCRSRSKRRASL
jgi:hypothetical protein